MESSFGMKVVKAENVFFFFFKEEARGTLIKENVGWNGIQPTFSSITSGVGLCLPKSTRARDKLCTQHSGAKIDHNMNPTEL